MLLSNLPEENKISISVNYISENEKLCAFEIANKLRRAGFEVDFIYDGNFKKQMKKSSQNNSRFVVIIGENEIKNQDAVVKDFKTSKEQKIKQNLLIHYLQGKL